MGEANSQGLFDSAYYRSHCGEIPYQHNDAWINMFDHVAERIIADIQPKTVLDAGCAYGILVERLRARGVEAWGLDISEYAIERVAPEMREYCQVGSILDALPRRYDLIVSIEVVEHIPAEDAMRAIENLCRYSDDILISTTPYDYKEPTTLTYNRRIIGRASLLGIYITVKWNSTDPLSARGQSGFAATRDPSRKLSRVTNAHCGA